MWYGEGVDSAGYQNHKLLFSVAQAAQHKSDDLFSFFFFLETSSTLSIAIDPSFL